MRTDQRSAQSCRRFPVRQLSPALQYLTAYLLELLSEKGDCIQISQPLLGKPFLHILDNLVRIFGSGAELGRPYETFSSAEVTREKGRRTFTSSAEVIESLGESSPVFLQSLRSSLGVLPTSIVPPSISKDLQTLGLEFHRDTDIYFLFVFELDH